MIYTRVLAALVILAAGFAAGWHVQAWRWEAADAKRIEAEAEAKREHDRVAASASQTFEDKREQIRTQIQTITREVEHVVEKPVYRNVCLDPDGLRLIGRAITGTDDAAGKPGDTVPAPADAR